MTPVATVAVLLYGDYPNLAERCLGPLWPLQRSGLIRLSIGCNAVGEATIQYLDRNEAFSDNDIQIVGSRTNIHKYPMMRHLLAASKPLERFMWFDDDSYIDDPDPASVVKKSVDLCEPKTMVGQVWFLELGGNQYLWVRDQPWYAGLPVEPRHKVRFCTGGWWVAPSELLLKHDWPPVTFERKGGDVMLGEMCRQQGVVLRDVGKSFGVRINANEKGEHSRMATRGPLPVPRPIGWDYQPGVTARVLDAVGDAPQQ